MAKLIDVDLKGLKTTALYAAPAVPSHAAVVVTYHREGLDDFTAWKVDQLAAAGFQAIAPNHYHCLPAGVGLTSPELRTGLCASGAQAQTILPY